MAHLLLLPRVRRLNFAQKEEMTVQIYECVGEIYSKVAHVDQLLRKLAEFFEEDHEYRREGSEKDFVQEMLKVSGQLEEVGETVLTELNRYINVVKLFDYINYNGTKRLIAIIQSEMPNRIVSPRRLAPFVGAKLTLADDAFTKVHRICSEMEKNKEKEQEEQEEEGEGSKENQ